MCNCGDRKRVVAVCRLGLVPGENCKALLRILLAPVAKYIGGSRDVPCASRQEGDPTMISMSMMGWWLLSKVRRFL